MLNFETMDLTVNGTTFQMTGMKSVYGFLLAGTFVTIGQTVEGWLHSILLAAAMITAVLSVAHMWHKYRVARREDIAGRSDNERR